MVKRKIVVWLFPLLFLWTQAVDGYEDNESIYYVIIDRFNNVNLSNDGEKNLADLNTYQGGDLAGVTDKLDYIQEMGFTVVALSPVMKSDHYDGQAIVNFEQLDEHWGTMEELNELTDAAHQRGMKVIVDFHGKVSDGHEWRNDAEKKEWLVDSGSTLNLSNEEVQDYVINVLTNWMNDGNIDGFRFLQVEEAPYAFWERVIKELKSQKKDSFLIANVSDVDLDQYETLSFDAFMDENVRKEITGAFSTVNMSLKGVDEAFNKDVRVIASMDDAGTIRFTRTAFEQKQFPVTRSMLALAYMYASPSIPFVVYGSEVALDGGEGALNDRVMSFRTSTEIVDYIKDLANLRKSFPALQHGSYEALYEKDGVLVFKRSLEDEDVLVAINNTTNTQKVTLSYDMLSEGKELHGQMVGGVIRGDDEGYTLVVERESAEFFVVSDEKGINYLFVSVFLIIPLLFIVFLRLANRKKS